MKYKSLAELKQVIDSGELKLSGGYDKLMLDNDNTSLYVGDHDSPDVERVFEMHPNQLLEEALTLLGIPWDYV
jgi:hypothetical protein